MLRAAKADVVLGGKRRSNALRDRRWLHALLTQSKRRHINNLQGQQAERPHCDGESTTLRWEYKKEDCALDLGERKGYE